jgi:HEAT repeat protein
MWRQLCITSILAVLVVCPQVTCAGSPLKANSKDPAKRKLFLIEGVKTYSGLQDFLLTVGKLLDDPVEEVQLEAAKAVSELGPLAGADHAIHVPNQVVPALAKGLSHKKPKVRKEMAFALVCIGPAAAPAVTALIKALKDENVEVRRHAANALRNIGPGAHQAVRALIAAIGDPDDPVAPESVSVPRLSIEALGWIGPKAKASIPVLLKLYQDRTKLAVLRAAAAGSLVKIGGKEDPMVIQAFLDVLDNPKETTTEHVMAALAIADVGPPAKAAVPAMCKLLDLQKLANYANPDDVLEALVTALGKFGPDAKSAVPQLAAFAGDTNRPWSVRGGCLKALGKIGPAAKQALPTLREMMLNEKINDNHIVEAADVMVKIGPAAVPDMIGVLGVGPDTSRWCAAKALGKVGVANDEVIAALATATNDANVVVRDEAKHALSLLKQKKGK